MGVYANASIRDIKANEARAKVFLNVGKELTFQCDFSELEKINRSPELLATANSQIILPNEKVKQALFWFVKVTPIDEIAFNHLAAGNTEQSINIWKKRECFSSLLNISTQALIEGNLFVAVDAMMTLLQSEKYKTELVKAITDETFQISEEELAHSYLDAFIPDSASSLLDLSTLPEKYKKYIKDKLISPAVKTIEMEIDKAKAVKHENARERYKAGVALANTTKPLLSKLKTFLQSGDLQYQMIADKLGLEILQCGIDYYNNSGEVDSPRKAMKLQKYALSVVVGQMAKDRCKQNVDILQKVIDELPPEEVTEEANIIKNKLALSYLNPCNIDKSNELMQDCAPYIIRIKEKLGTVHKYYLNISTQIVQIVLHNIIGAVNRAIEEINNQMMYSRIEFNEILKNAWIATLNMEIFDLQPSFKNERFLSQKEKLRGILQSARVSTSSISANLDLRTEDEIYNSCSSLTDYETYLKKFPQGKYLSQAKFSIEVKRYKSCKTEEQYQDYINRYPKGRYLQEAISKRDELHRIAEVNKHKDDEAYRSCNSITDFQEYIKKFPKGIHVAQAKGEISRIKNEQEMQKEIEYYKSCSSIPDLENYIAAYPCGVYYYEAKERIKKKVLQNKILTACFVTSVIILTIALICS